jgi:hypothetical protein
VVRGHPDRHHPAGRRRDRRGREPPPDPALPRRRPAALGHHRRRARGSARVRHPPFATHHAPPYYALLGAHRAGLAGWATLGRCAARFPTHTALDPARAGRANPLPDGGWLDLDTEPGDRYTGRATAGTRTGLVVDLVERLVA